MSHTAQDTIHGVEQVAPHHRDLVDDDQIELADELPLVLAVAACDGGGMVGICQRC